MVEHVLIFFFYLFFAETNFKMFGDLFTHLIIKTLSQSPVLELKDKVRHLCPTQVLLFNKKVVI